MKRWWLMVMSLVVLLTGCAGEAFRDAYAVRGDDNLVSDLPRTDTFTPTEDLQVVVAFESHTRDLDLAVEWRNPAGQQVERFEVLVPSDAEYMLVEYNLEQADVPYWEPGEWTVRIRIGEELVDTLTFTVEGDIPDIEEADAEDDDEFDVDNPSNPFGN